MPPLPYDIIIPLGDETTDMKTNAPSLGHGGEFLLKFNSPRKFKLDRLYYSVTKYDPGSAAGQVKITHTSYGGGGITSWTFNVNPPGFNGRMIYLGTDAQGKTFPPVEQGNPNGLIIDVTDLLEFEFIEGDGAIAGLKLYFKGSCFPILT